MKPPKSAADFFMEQPNLAAEIAGKGSRSTDAYNGN